MAPVLEDAILAKRAAEGSLTVRDLLMYSAVCGTGLDTIPLPGDVTADQVAALLLDIAALSLRPQQTAYGQADADPRQKKPEMPPISISTISPTARCWPWKSEGLGEIAGR